MAISPPDPALDDQNPHRLDAVLGLFSVVAIVVGEVIGSGIFYKPQPIAQATGGFVGLILALWVLCGVVNLCGALTMAELAAMFPHAGGTYVFLRETYGRLWAFLWAWGEFWVIRTGAIAALAAYSAEGIEKLLVQGGFTEAGHQKSIAVVTIAALATINIAGTRWGNGVQTIATLIKAGFVAFLAFLPFIALESGPIELGRLWPATFESNLALGTAVAAIMWAYDGWGNVTVVAEEVHNPRRNIPIALVTGVMILIVLYTGANLAYHLTLPSSEIAAQVCPAVAVCEKLLPNYGAKLMQAMILISVFGALNVNILVGPRVLFAVARDHHFLRHFSRIHPTTRTPAWSIAGMSAWASALLLLDGLSSDPNVRVFDLMTEWTVFGGSIFYFSAVAGVFLLRFRRPNAERPYRTWGYPLVPLIFLAFYVFLLYSMFVERPGQRLIGLGLISLGLVAYFGWGQRQPLASADEAPPTPLLKPARD